MKFKPTRRAVLAAACLAIGGLAPALSQAQAPWPSQPIKIIVPFPAGGASDQIARLVGQKISEELKQSVVIENRSGANGSVGGAMVAKAAPDGYTLLVGSIGVFTINAGLYRNLPYDPLKDFAPISVLVSTPNVLVVPTNSRFKTGRELADYMKKNPGKLSYASSGNGSSDHLSAELFKKAVGGGYAVHIPYRGGAPAMQDIIAGQADFMFSNLGPAVPFIKGGKMRALMLTSGKAAPSMPEIPTSTQEGVTLDVTSWQAIAAPAGTPPAIIARLSQAAVKGMNSPDVKEKMAAQGFDVVANSPAEFSQYLAREVARWKTAVKESGAVQD